MRGAIFDMDGLLIDSEKLWQGMWHTMAEEHGITLPASFAGDICGTGGAQTREVLRQYFYCDDPEPLICECTERVYRLEAEGVPLKPGAKNILAGMHAAGYRIAVASSSPMDMIRKNLEKNGVAEYFNMFISGQEVRNGKPAPDIFLLAAERLGVPPEECYVFEDSRNGIEAGWRAGCRSVMVPDLVQPTDETRRMSFCICRDLDEAWERIRA